jgi:hypothetical protein
MVHSLPQVAFIWASLLFTLQGFGLVFGDLPTGILLRTVIPITARVGCSVLRYLGSPSPTRKTLQRCFVAGICSLSGLPHRPETAIDGQLYGLRRASYTSCYLPHIVVRIDHWNFLLRILITKIQDLSRFRFPLSRVFSGLTL